MNTVAILVYLGSIIGTIDGIVFGATLLSTVALIVGTIGRIIVSTDSGFQRDTEAREVWGGLWKKVHKFAIPIFCICLPLTILVPDTKTFYMIIGAHYGEEVVQSEQLQNMGAKGLEMLDHMMEEKLDQLKGQSDQSS